MQLSEAIAGEAFFFFNSHSDILYLGVRGPDLHFANYVKRYTEFLNKLSACFQFIPGQCGLQRSGALGGGPAGLSFNRFGFQTIPSITSIHRGGYSNHVCSPEETALTKLKEEKVSAQGSYHQRPMQLRGQIRCDFKDKEGKGSIELKNECRWGWEWVG